MMEASNYRVAIGLGANKGDPLQNLRRAIEKLREGGLCQVKVSAVYETDPVDCVPGTPAFFNMAVIGRWAGSPVELMHLCKSIERQIGRPVKHSSRVARLIDLDLLLFDQVQQTTEQLTVPHPMILTRLFVLAPLSEICPEWLIRGTDLTVKDACQRLYEQTAEPDKACRRVGNVGLQ